MSRHLSASILLASSQPERLDEFYRAAFDVEADENGWFSLGGLGVNIDLRDDVAERVAEPGRVVLNIDTEHAAEVVARLDDLGVRWLVRLEERPNGIFSTFEDPDGNLVQVLQMTQEYRDSRPDPA
ncbi:MAG: Glyoxalase/bleomycin resistance protein/dioxygenase [Nocardioides sp.]|nr:Glyoxalase/bleomycin resistance protein/dioxygenase [Nocardioides sp.]